MLMVIFGAGASHDSVYPSDLPSHPAVTTTQGAVVTLQDWGHPERPPLAKGLIELRTEFGGAINSYPDVRPLIARLRRVFEGGGPVDIELELDGLIAASEASEPHLLRQLAAFRFYLRDIIYKTCATWPERAHGITNYHTLLERLQAWRFQHKEQVCLVTFNYDTLIERAIMDVLRWPINGLADYIGGDDWEWSLLKLHGSTSWVRYVEPTPPVAIGNEHSVKRGLIEQADEIRPTDKYAWVGDTPQPVVIHESSPALPALAIPTTVKADFECPREHIARLLTALPEITKVLVIGWRATEDHFLKVWNSLVPEGVRGFVVNNSHAESDTVGMRLSRGTAQGVLPTEIGFSTLLNRKAGEEGEQVLAELLER